MPAVAPGKTPEGPDRSMDRLSDAAEHLDGSLDDRAVLVGNLRDLRRVNRVLGGSALTAWGVRHLLDGAGGPATILDVGTGGADIPLALLAAARRDGHDLRIHATDHRPEVLAAARAARPGIETVAGLVLEVADGRRLPYPDESFDVAHASLVVHHLDPADAVGFLHELGRVARLGVVVNDLERSRWGWIGAWLVGHVLTTNAYTRHDAPLSVRRAYTLGEMRRLLERAGLRPVAVRHGPFHHRYAIVAARSAAGWAQRPQSR